MVFFTLSFRGSKYLPKIIFSNVGFFSEYEELKRFSNNLSKTNAKFNNKCKNCNKEIENSEHHSFKFEIVQNFWKIVSEFFGFD